MVLEMTYLDIALKAKREIKNEALEPRNTAVRAREISEISEGTHWPEPSLAAEKRFSQPHTRLFPFVNRRVWSPAGPGLLLAVFAGQCEVLLDGQTKTVRIPTERVEPLQ